MRRFEGNMLGQQFCADLGIKVVHDLDRETPECDIDKIIAEHKDKPYFKLIEAYLENFSPCQHCIRLPSIY